MIRMHVDAVVQVRDDFTGRAVESGGLRCALDGVPCRPVRKLGGGLVLVNLPEGPHRLTVRCLGFREEQVDFSAAPGVTHELYMALKPGEGYPFRQEAVRLFLTVTEKGRPARDEVLWLTAPGAPVCKIAQTKVQPGAEELRLYWKGSPAQLPVPGPFLVDDGEDTEIVTVQKLGGETGRLAAPLQKKHGRGRLLLPAQAYRTGETGEISAAFHTAGAVCVYCAARRAASRIELAGPVTRQTLTL